MQNVVSQVVPDDDPEGEEKKVDGCRKNKRMRMDDDTTRNRTKDNFSVIESTDTEQTPKKSLILLRLPNDLLDLIICNLDLVDRFHLRLVCKSFSALVLRNATGINAKTKFGVPCFLAFARDRKTCSLINPVHKEMYNINTPSLPANAEILCAKDGWLLMAVKDQKSVFFFNPSTKATVRLPDLTNIPFWQCFSFSCPPTSPDCVVIAMSCVRPRTVLKTCRRGEEHWVRFTHYMGAFSSEMYDSTKAVFYRGNLYCLRSDGMLGIFDLVKLTWKVFKKKSKSITPNPSHQHFLIESKGRLLRVVWVAADSQTKKGRVEVHYMLKEYGWKRCLRVGKLEDITLYISRIASLSSKTLPAGSRRKIYVGNLQDLCGTIFSPDGCWIEPDCTHSFPQELQWISKA